AEQNTYGIKPGDPIFIFDKNQLDALHLTDKEMEYVKPFYKNSDIHRGFVDSSELQFVIYSDDIDNVDETLSLKQHFERLGALLRDRLIRYEEDYRWFNLHRGRNKNIFESEKLVTSRRAKENTFAYENQRSYPQSDITLITPKKGTQENLKYLFALLNSDYLNHWYGKNTKMKGNMREFYFTPMSKVPIRKIDFNDPDEIAIHNILGGIYSPFPKDDPDYQFDENTQTYVRQKGLTDYYIAGKTTLYHLQKAGFEFDPESEISEASSIRINLCAIADFLVNRHLSEINFVRDVMLYYPALIKDPTLYSFSTSEKAELTKLLTKCKYFIKTTTKDFTVKAVKSDRIVSLFNDSGDFCHYGFECSIDLVTNNNQSIEVDCKTPNDAMYLVDMIQSHLKKLKSLTWEDLMAFPVMNEEIEKFIQEKRTLIVNMHRPINEKAKERLDEIFINRELEPLAKINNLNYLQYLIDKCVDFLYK
ncbi:MAG: TaqI-like C-terminal specificity domain-containing protein, partial [bacterium]